MNPLFSGRGLCKAFGAQVALRSIDFDLRRGEVMGLIGANGAGKSTLLKIMAGAFAPDQGRLELNGAAVRFRSTRDAARFGVALVSQELSLFPDLTIAENFDLAAGAAAGSWLGGGGRRREQLEALHDLGLRARLDSKLGRLSLGDRQLVEIARALLQRPHVLILDEPTSALHKAEKDRLTRVIRTLRDRGVGVFYVSHFLEELLDIVDDFIVLRDGAQISLDRAPTVGRLKAVVAAMLGPSSASNGARDEDHQFKPPGMASAHGVAMHGPLHLNDVAGPRQLKIGSLTVAPGEVIGVSGLAGAGIEELFAILFGRVPLRRGTIVLPSHRAAPKSSQHAVAAGVAFIPADRKRLGLMLDKSVHDNIVSVRALAQGRDGAFLRTRAAQQRTRCQSLALGIKATSMRQPVGQLSGGNQQKVVFAKWLEAEPSLVLLDDPTRGVDVGAKREMHCVIRRLAAEGRVVLMFSSEPRELVEVAQRVLVFVDGMIRDTLEGDRLTEHGLVQAINTRPGKEGSVLQSS